jgi:hypothetical protein
MRAAMCYGLNGGLGRLEMAMEVGRIHLRDSVHDVVVAHLESELLVVPLGIRCLQVHWEQAILHSPCGRCGVGYGYVEEGLG